MNIKHLITKTIFFLFVGIIFIMPTNAQLCGTYGATLNVKNEKDEPVENAFVQLLPIGKDETKGQTFVRDKENLSKLTITFSEGHQITTKYKLLTSAGGFENFEKEIGFPHCKRQIFDIRLKANEKPNTAILNGSVYDANGALITGAKVTAANEKGEKFETVSSGEGIYILELPYNPYNAKNHKYKTAKYEITVKAEGFDKSVLQNFGFVPSTKGKMILDFTLDVFLNINTINIDSEK